jgi:TRAP-type mannitol/chloroaromatic compound transport system permease small subunit
VLKACVPAGFVLVFLQGISLGIKSLFTIVGRDIGKDIESETES